jgi:protein required for attachment to host cells
MEDGGTTWVLAADGGSARMFEERRRSGELVELTERRMHRAQADLPATHAHGATVHDRMGQGRHGAGEASPQDEAERRFLSRVVAVLASGNGDFDHLVILAPPKALGILRAALPQRLAERLQASHACDCVKETPEEVRRRLRDARGGD